MGTQLETSDLHQFAVLWEVHPKADQYGKQAVRRPVEIKVRWQKGVMFNKSPSVDATEKIVAQVFVDREIKPRSILWQGRKKDLPSDTNLTDLRTVLDNDEIPDVDGKNPRRFVLLAKPGLPSRTL